jgi:5'-deoxynucleotidase YfbR-like HD superfamily hydrolase
MRTDKELDGILRFMLRADKLKEIERTGWLISKVKDPEHMVTIRTVLQCCHICLPKGWDYQRKGVP